MSYNIYLGNCGTMDSEYTFAVNVGGNVIATKMTHDEYEVVNGVVKRAIGNQVPWSTAYGNSKSGAVSFGDASISSLRVNKELTELEKCAFNLRRHFEASNDPEYGGGLQDALREFDEAVERLEK